MGGRSRNGSVYLLVLLVMISGMSLVTGVQHVLIRRSRGLEQAQTEQKLHNALLLGLRESLRLLAADDDLTVDSAEEEWARPRTYTSTRGVRLYLQLEDAQSRFNLNHLSLPVTPMMPRTWMEIFRDLLRDNGVPLEAEALSALQAMIVTEEIWFESPEVLTLLLSGIEPEGLDQVGALLTALPRPGSRPLPMNINTVRPEVLRALVGDALQGWVDTVLAARENEPIRNPANLLQTLPAPVRPLLNQVLGVRSEYVSVRMLAELDGAEQTLTALLKRSGEEVEVLRCQW